MKSSRMARAAVMIITLFFAGILLLIPEQSCHAAVIPPAESARKAFVWNQDAYWKALEAKYAELRQSGCRAVAADVNEQFKGIKKLLAILHSKSFGPGAPEFDELERRMFETAPMVSACKTGLAE